MQKTADKLHPFVLPALLTISIGLGFTAYTAYLVWGQAHVFLPLATLVVMCFILTGVQGLLPEPTCALSALCGPAHVFFMLLGIGLLWVAEHCGVHYAPLAPMISKHGNPSELWATAGAFAGWACATFWPASYMLVHGEGGVYPRYENY